MPELLPTFSLSFEELGPSGSPYDDIVRFRVEFDSHNNPYYIFGSDFVVGIVFGGTYIGQVLIEVIGGSPDAPGGTGSGEGEFSLAHCSIWENGDYTAYCHSVGYSLYSPEITCEVRLIASVTPPPKVINPTPILNKLGVDRSLNKLTWELPE